MNKWHVRKQKYEGNFVNLSVLPFNFVMHIRIAFRMNLSNHHSTSPSITSKGKT